MGGFLRSRAALVLLSGVAALLGCQHESASLSAWPQDSRTPSPDASIELERLLVFGNTDNGAATAVMLRYLEDTPPTDRFSVDLANALAKETALESAAVPSGSRYPILITHGTFDDGPGAPRPTIRVTYGTEDYLRTLKWANPDALAPTVTIDASVIRRLLGR